MTSENTTLDEEERHRVNNNHEDLETLLANREAQSEDAQKMDEMMLVPAEEPVAEAAKTTEKDPFLIANKQESLFCCKRKGANYLII